MKTTISMQPASKAGLATRVSDWLESDNYIFSTLMEESVTNRQTLLITNAMLSGIALLGSAFACVEALLFVFAWFAWSVNLCKKGGFR